MPSIRRCFLCGYKYNPENARIMMHSFPWREDINKQWREVCNILPTDNVTNLFICSKHFQPEDYYKSHSFSKKYNLQVGAVPSKELPRGLVNTFDMSFKGNSDLPSTRASTSYDENIMEGKVYAEVKGASEGEGISEVEGISGVQSTSKTTIDLQSTSFGEITHIEVEGNAEEILVTTATLVEDMQSTRPSASKNRRFLEPRYINEISPSHVKTPRRAKRVIDFVKRTHKNQTVKIKQLQDANRLLNKKVLSLEHMVAHLKEKTCFLNMRENT